MPRLASTAILITVASLCGAVTSPLSRSGAQPASSALTAADVLTVVPGHSLGSVSLGESKRHVVNQVGACQGHSPTVRYCKEGTTSIIVDYSPTNRVWGVQTQAGTTRVYGEPLARPVAVLQRILRSHGWTIGSCSFDRYATLTNGHRGTTILWQHNRFQMVVLLADGTYSPCNLSP